MADDHGPQHAADTSIDWADRARQALAAADLLRVEDGDQLVVSGPLDKVLETLTSLG